MCTKQGIIMKKPGISAATISPSICPTHHHSKILLGSSAFISVGIIYLSNYFKMIKRDRTPGIQTDRCILKNVKKRQSCPCA
jgi:hypothetical protein